MCDGFDMQLLMKSERWWWKYSELESTKKLYVDTSMQNICTSSCSCEVKTEDRWLMCCKFCQKQAVGMFEEEVLDLFCRFSCLFLCEQCVSETDHKQLVPVPKREHHQLKIWGKRGSCFSRTNILLAAHHPSQRRRTRNYTEMGRKVPSDFHRRSS